jgi:hypothetical protein
MGKNKLLDNIKEKETNPVGRPVKTVIDIKAVERAALIGCTADEIAVILGVPRSTFFLHKENNPEIEEAIVRGRDGGRGTLRRMQWDKAKKGSDTMLIWLGKNMLGQRDKQPDEEAADRTVNIKITGGLPE